ncbi:hypothetical protein L209DRAFT_55788 [Thermothelomyces heterothallicus CBS 203.75]
MAAIVADTPGSAMNSGKADATSLRTLSVTTAASHDLPSSVSSPASAASPSNVSTPTSSTSSVPPIAIRPNTSSNAPPVRPSTTMHNRTGPGIMTPGSAPQPKTVSMTSKEWVIPPRPKPGRKPATDTPPTKRKAQNRAAQRAFRERRAARVGELEEQLEQDRVKHERTVRELQERISHLEIETQTLQSRCQWLESMLERERQGRDNFAGDWEAQQGGSRNNSSMSSQIQGQLGRSQSMRPLQPAPSKTGTAHPAPIIEPRPLAQPFSISQIVSPPEESTQVNNVGCGSCGASGSCACAEEVLRSADIPIGCGKCSLGTRCQCLEETIRVSIAGPDLKRPPSAPPSTSPEDKRQRSDTGTALETDFTAIFASQNNKEESQALLPAQAQSQPLASIEPRDPCGFCKEGTYCVCADSMMTPTSLAAPVNQATEQTQTHTPPPSDNDVVPMPLEVTATGAIKLPGLKSLQERKPAKLPARAGGCGPNGPGTCAQCVADPKSGLFCRSLAANFEKNNAGASTAAEGGCCGNGSPGGCCKSGSSQSQQPAETTSLPPMASSAGSNGSNASGFGLSLSCADAYKTLASHRHFDEAADDIGSWLPKLKALPVPRHPGPVGGGGRGHRDARAPIEVEAASIMSVLKDFDVRFGRGE